MFRPRHIPAIRITSQTDSVSSHFRPSVESFVANSIPPIAAALPNVQQAPQKITGAPHSPSTTGSAPDRIARQSNPLPALLLGATAAAQLVPGVVEAEGATGAATAIGIVVRAVAANPVAKAVLATAGGALGTYARSLVHDATAGQPAFKSVNDFGQALDASVHSSLGIPQNDAR